MNVCRKLFGNYKIEILTFSGMNERLHRESYISIITNTKVWIYAEILASTTLKIFAHLVNHSWFSRANMRSTLEFY